jgi:hypothetical protein
MVIGRKIIMAVNTNRVIGKKTNMALDGYEVQEDNGYLKFHK